MTGAYNRFIFLIYTMSFCNNIEQNTAIMAMRGPTTGLLLRGSPTPPHSHAPPQPPLAAIGPLVTPAYAGLQDPRWEAMMWSPMGNLHPSS